MTTYQIDGLEIKWGETVGNVRILLDGLPQFKPYGGWPNIRCECKSAFGLATTVFAARGPFEDRPVMQVHYEVSPIRRGFFEEMHSPYLRQLKKVLGNPIKQESYSQPHVKKANLYGTVVFSAQWIFDDIKISLSVYGGVRGNDSGNSGAGIFIDWIDEIKAAMPFSKITARYEKVVSEHMRDDIPMDKFRLEYKQKAFIMAHYDLQDPFIARHDSALRVAQLALYKPRMYRTPNAVSNRLHEDEIGFFKVAEPVRFFVSNKWDTVELLPGEAEGLHFFEILPARGPGGRTLELNGLTIEDSKNNDALIRIIERIEAETGLNIQRRETYDD